MHQLTGGNINEAYAIELQGGTRLFLKTSPQAPPGSFTAEAASLRWTAAAPGGPRVPAVRSVVDPADADGPRMLILEHVAAGRLSELGAERLGRELAALHRAGAPAHAAPAPGTSATFIGPLQLPAGEDPRATWPEVYANLRLMPVARTADARGALPEGGLGVIGALCERLPALAGPAEPPSRLHGDLWAGNVMADLDGNPWLIDPAAYGGHRELDLAMLRLFGGPGERCFAAYDEAHPLADGHRERIALWQIFPVLVHAALFGGGYGPRAIQAARDYM
jgi:fructosamine-3-kinase